jgi:hypothetical protein
MSLGFRVHAAASILLRDPVSSGPLLYVCDQQRAVVATTAIGLRRTQRVIGDEALQGFKPGQKRNLVAASE